MSDPAYPDWMLRDGPPAPGARRIRRRYWLAAAIVGACIYAVIARAVMEAW